MLTVVPDTNIFLQCRALEELDWATAFPGADIISLTVPRVVIAEIDRLKNDGNSRRARRSRAASGRFREILRSESQQVIIRESGPRVILRFAPRSRLLPEDHPDLDLSINDDRLIGEALELSKKEPVAILTNDIGVELTAKEMNLDVRPLPENWLLPPETDPLEKESRRRAEPSIDIDFIDQLGNEVDVLVQPILSCALLSQPTKLEIAGAIKARFPISPIVRELGRSGYGLDFYSLTNPFGPSISTIQEYKSDYYTWLRGLDEWLDNLPEKIELRSRFFRFRVRISNSGGGPAEQLRLDLEASEGLIFVESDMGEFLISPPEPPEEPRSIQDIALMTPLAKQLEDLKQSDRDPFVFYYREAPDGSERASRVSLTCESLHPSGMTEAVVACCAQDGTNAGAVSATLSARNLGRPVAAKLPIRLERREMRPNIDDEYLKLILDPFLAKSFVNS